MFITLYTGETFLILAIRNERESLPATFNLVKKKDKVAPDDYCSAIQLKANFPEEVKHKREIKMSLGFLA